MIALYVQFNLHIAGGDAAVTMADVTPQSEEDAPLIDDNSDENDDHENDDDSSHTHCDNCYSLGCTERYK